MVNGQELTADLFYYPSLITVKYCFYSLNDIYHLL
ncbi:MAG: hypothetical protein ACI8VT_003450, partial [Saprospiraceae bacterium]